MTVSMVVSLLGKSGYLSSVFPPHPSAQNFESRFEFETLISDTSASLFAAPPDRLEFEIECALERVREFFRADRCALLSVSADRKVVQVRLASYAKGLTPLPPDLNLAPAFPWSYHRLLVERAPVRVARIAELPPEADVERAAWRQLPIRSALSLPIETGGSVGHIIVLNTVHHEREWPDVFVTRLRVLGELLVAALLRKEMVSGLRASEAEMRDLSRRLIRAHEEERAMLARELHDDVTQRLAVLAIDVGRAESAALGGPHAEAMRSVREGLTRLSEDVHSLAYQLHPSVLAELGLVDALRTECERIERKGQFALSVDLATPPVAVPKHAALCLFRVAQEALNNVTRHAGARTASVSLRAMDGGVLLAVRDDGVGFDPAVPRGGGSLGLASMRERVRLVNGTLEIASAPGQGTEIVVWVPLEPEPE
jgi:signal transduction histidine kinase